METTSQFFLNREAQTQAERLLPLFSEEYVSTTINEIKQEKGVENLSPREKREKRLRSGFTAEMFKENYELKRQEKGERYLAFSLGLNYFQSLYYDWDEDVEAIESFLPEIRKKPELAEIFSTAFHLRAEEEKVLFGPAVDIMYAYYLQILASSKPTATGEYPPIPKLCIEAVKYENRSESIPQDHVHACSICSQKG